MASHAADADDVQVCISGRVAEFKDYFLAGLGEAASLQYSAFRRQ
jgi:hypothetical protein